MVVARLVISSCYRRGSWRSTARAGSSGTTSSATRRATARRSRSPCSTSSRRTRWVGCCWLWRGVARRASRRKVARRLLAMVKVVVSAPRRVVTTAVRRSSLRMVKSQSPSLASSPAPPRPLARSLSRQVALLAGSEQAPSQLLTIDARSTEIVNEMFVSCRSVRIPACACCGWVPSCAS